MADSVKWTEAELKKLEKRIKAEYTKAYQEMRKEMVDIIVRLQDPNLSPQERIALMAKNDRLQKLSEQLATRLQDTNKLTTNFVTKSAQNIFKYNYNAEVARLGAGYGFTLIDDTAVRNILTGEVNPFTKLSIAAEKDKAAIVRKLQSELTTGLLKGESIPNIAKRIKGVAENYLGDTVRIARTETTRVMNSAKQADGEEGKRLGLTMYKKWVASVDDRTRDEHVQADGQEVPIDEPFVVGGEQMMYPGDVSLGASAGNVINCRCTCVNVVHEKGYKG